MRDDSTEGMVELTGAKKVAPAVFACEAIIKVADETLPVRFSVDEQAYMLLKKMLSFQPFEPGSYGRYRYYFTGSYQKEDQHGKAYMDVRVEQNGRHKSFAQQTTQPITANLLWLQRLENAEQIAALRF